jgi:3-phenylpropionate/trans-cinnamate dioxygenase ferredoxin subunit
MFVRVASRTEVPEGRAVCVVVDERHVVLFNVEGELYALDDRCTHAGGRLSEGRVQGDEIECPGHAARFNIRTGEALTPPAVETLRRYRVRVSGDDVEVDV